MRVPLFWKLMISLVLLAFVPLSGTAIYFHTQLRENLEDSLKEKLERQLAILKLELKQQLRFYQTNLLVWSRLQVMEDLEVDDADGNIQTLLQDLQKAYPLIALLQCANKEGKIVASTERKNLKKTLKAKKTSQLVERKGKLYLCYTQPVKRQKQELGWIQMCLDLHQLVSSLPNFGEKEQTFVTWENHWLTPKGLEKQAFSIQKGFFLWRNQPHLYSYNSLPLSERQKLKLWIAVPKEFAFSKMRQWTQVQLVLLLSTFLFVILALAGISRSFTHPIHQISQALEAVGQRKFQPIRLHRRDELGELATRFNAMCKSLEKFHALQQNQLDLLARLIPIAAEGKPLKVLDFAFHQLLEKTQALAAAYYLYSAERKVYLPKRYYQVPKKFQNSQGYAPGEGIVGLSAQSQKTQELSSPQKSQEWVADTGLGTVALSHLLAIPFVYQDRVEAVFVLAKAEEFQPEEKEFSKLLVRQLAIGYDSARKGEELRSRAKELERQKQELEALYHKLQEISQYKSEFLAVMSHEIRTPMNGIMGMTDLLLTTNLTPTQRQYAQTILQCSQTLLHLLNDILDYSKIEAGKLSLDRHPFSLYQEVEQVVELYHSRASEKGVELAWWLDSKIPRQVIGDSLRFNQILANLLSNAVKFTEKGHISLSGRLVQFEDNQVEVEFSVEDTGVGIPKEKLDTIFEAFRQVDSSTTRRYGGTGLGLAIVRKLVELMNGRIWVESQVGKGTKFWFTVKFELPSQISEEELFQRQKQLEGRQVLIVDDNATNRKILVEQTKIWGMNPVSFELPKDALHWLEQNQPQLDVALLDYHMPQMDGVALAKAIRKMEKYQNLPLVLLSSAVERTENWEDFAGIMAKPLKLRNLYNLMQSIFGAREKVTEEATVEKQLLGEKLPAKILVVEDNPVNQQLVQVMFEKLGYTVDIAKDGWEALGWVEQKQYDLIFMDLQMPDMDGLECTKKIRQKLGEWAPPIVAMTADVQPKTRQAAQNVGMAGYVTKPFGLKDLERAIEQYLGREKEKKEEAHQSLDSSIAKNRDENNKEEELHQRKSSLKKLQPPVLDREKLKELWELGEDVAKDIWQSFLENAQKQIEQLYASLKQRKAQQLRHVAHTLKGMAYNAGAARLAHLAKQIQEAAEQEDWEQAKQDVNQLDSIWHATQVAYKEWQNDNAGE